MIVRMRPLLLVGSVTVLAMLAVSAWAWPQIPADARVPIHWDSSGEVDRYGSKLFGLLGLPAINLGLMLLLAFLPRIELRRQNLLRSRTAYVAIGVTTLLFLAGIHVLLVMAALGHDPNVGRLVMVGVGVLFLVIGNYLGKTRSNWFFGVRTPWTLSSELAWARTHRAAAWLFMVVGAVTILLAVLSGPQSAVWAMLGGLFGGAIAVVGYSYVVWRGDTNRRAPL